MAWFKQFKRSPRYLQQDSYQNREISDLKDQVKVLEQAHQAMMDSQDSMQRQLDRDGIRLGTIVYLEEKRYHDLKDVAWEDLKDAYEG